MEEGPIEYTDCPMTLASNQYAQNMVIDVKLRNAISNIGSKTANESNFETNHREGAPEPSPPTDSERCQEQTNIKGEGGEHKCLTAFEMSFEHMRLWDKPWQAISF